MGSVTIQRGGNTVVTLTRNTVASIASMPRDVFIDKQGLQGPPGPPGVASNDIIQLAAGEQIFANRVVCSFGSKAYLADPSTAIDDREVLGVSTNDAAPDQTVNIDISGQVSSPSFNFFSGPVYVGMNGTFTQVVPDPSNGFAWIAEIGVAASTNTLAIAPRFIADF